MFDDSYQLDKCRRQQNHAIPPLWSVPETLASKRKRDLHGRQAGFKDHIIFLAIDYYWQKWLYLLAK